MIILTGQGVYATLTVSLMRAKSGGRKLTIAIGGPTAVGKTATAIALAKRLCGEIISADSAAVYRGVDIGTAKPTPAEQRVARFHLIDVVGPNDDFSVAQFKALSLAAIEDIQRRGRTVIIAGGTGLYLRVLLEDYGLTSTPADEGIRSELNREAEEQGTAALHARLALSDRAAAEKIHPNDRKRVVRALEVLLRTGVPISAQQAADRERRRPIPARKFFLHLELRELERLIEARVEEQLAAGLEREVRELLAGGLSPSMNSLRSLGYKEMAAYILGETSYEDAVQAIKKNTRRFAKRQMTWFRSEPAWTWIEVGGKTPEQSAEAILDLLAQA